VIQEKERYEGDSGEIRISSRKEMRVRGSLVVIMREESAADPALPDADNGFRSKLREGQGMSDMKSNGTATSQKRARGHTYPTKKNKGKPRERWGTIVDMDKEVLLRQSLRGKQGLREGGGRKFGKRFQKKGCCNWVKFKSRPVG